jgi:hypothetical protein
MLAMGNFAEHTAVEGNEGHPSPAGRGEGVRASSMAAASRPFADGLVLMADEGRN